uniref:hypothetical protein n=1 Tax=uncultured Dysgonomonas sp. TaxID=206096 RepID=UPI00261D06B7|nr:hypothetical protein [uncultured Dysgonomonas sp.]
MREKEFDEIHDYDYNEGIENSDITGSEITTDNYQSNISPTEPSSVGRSMFTDQNERTDSNVFDNETTMNMIQGTVVNTVDIEELRAQQNFPLALIAGLAASFLCILIWTLITVLTKYQITYMAIGVGFAVGFSIQKLGKGITPVYGILGAVLALLTCFVGNFLSSVCLIADELNYSYSEMFSSLDVDTSILIVKETFQFMDIVFYGIAIYTGYLCSIKSES